MVSIANFTKFNSQCTEIFSLDSCSNFYQLTDSGVPICLHHISPADTAHVIIAVKSPFSEKCTVLDGTETSVSRGLYVRLPF